MTGLRSRCSQACYTSSSQQQGPLTCLLEDHTCQVDEEERTNVSYVVRQGKVIVTYKALGIYINENNTVLWEIKRKLMEGKIGRSFKRHSSLHCYHEQGDIYTIVVKSRSIYNLNHINP